MYLFLISALPVFLICLFIYKKDKNREPKKLLFKLFFLGMLSCIPACFLEILCFGNYNPTDMSIGSVFIYSFFGVALIEELCKFFVTYRVSYNNYEFDEVYDMIIYATFVSLGFAFLENVCYVSLYGYVTGFLRAILSVPFHACNGIFMGYYLGIAKTYGIRNNKKEEKNNIMMAIVMAITTHGFYDFCVFSGNLLFFIIFIIYVIFMYSYCIKRVNNVSNLNERIR